MARSKVRLKSLLCSSTFQCESGVPSPRLVVCHKQIAWSSEPRVAWKSQPRESRMNQLIWTERDGGEAGNAGKKALRNAVRRALLCGQCRYRGNTIPHASIGKILHKEMVKSLHVSLGSALVGCRHLEWPLVPETVSPVCPSPSGAFQRRKRIVSCIGVWSFNAESCCAAGRLEELLHIARQQNFHIAYIQETQLVFNSDWLTGERQVYSLSKSGVCISDGCIIATRSPTISPNCVKAIHRWEPGRVLGLRIQVGQVCSQLDLCVLNSHSPTNSQGATSEAREAHELSRAAHWQKCERVLRRIPRRCELVWAMDGNARMGTALPWVGAGGSRSKHREVWNSNGGDLF